VINRIADSVPAKPLKSILIPYGSSILISGKSPPVDEENGFCGAGKRTGAKSSI